MEGLAEVFREGSTDRKKREHLKEKLQKDFHDELLFLNVTFHSLHWLYTSPACKASHERKQENCI